VSWQDKADYYVVLHSNKQISYFDTLELYGKGNLGTIMQTTSNSSYSVFGFAGKMPRRPGRQPWVAMFPGYYATRGILKPNYQNLCDWEIEFCDHVQPTNSDIDELLEFSLFRPLLRSFSNWTLSLSGQTVTRDDHAKRAQELGERLGTQIRVFAYCTGCERSVPVEFDKRSQGTHLRCAKPYCRKNCS